MHKVLYTAEAKNLIEKLTLKKKRQIKNAIERIAIDPSLGKRLMHELSGMWSYRSGDFRIIYRVEHHRLVIIVLTLGHRKNIYHKAKRLISR